MKITAKKAYCSKGFDETEDEATMSARQIAHHKDAIEDYKDQLSNTEGRIEVARKSIDERNSSFVMLVTSGTMLQREHRGAVSLAHPLQGQD